MGDEHEGDEEIADHARDDTFSLSRDAADICCVLDAVLTARHGGCFQHQQHSRMCDVCGFADVAQPCLWRLQGRPDACERPVLRTDAGEPAQPVHNVYSGMRACAQAD